MDIVGLVFDALATMVEDIPIIGDIVGFVASLFGNSSASNARIARLETIVSKGSSGYDDFNRSDTSSLGRGPQMTADWVTGGNGQALGVQGRAAGLVEALAPADGRRWARYPSPASSSTMTADTIVDDKKLDNQACTTVVVAANAAFTEFVYANVFGTGVYLGRGTRSGNSWSFNDWKSNTSYKVGTAERVEVRASGSGIYQLVVDNTVILEHTDVSYPIDVDHRFVGFAIQCWTGILQLPEYGWRLSAFSLKSEAGTFTAIESVETVANGAVTVANGAQTAAENAVGTAVTQATAAATEAVTIVRKEIIQTISVFDIKSPRPLHESFNPTVYSSFPQSELEFDFTIAATNLGSHLHGENNQTGAIRNTDSTNLGSHGHAVTYVRPTITLATTEHLFTCIRVEQDGELEGVSIAAVPNTTITGLYFRVYVMSALGDITYTSPESPNQKASLGDGQLTDPVAIAWTFADKILLEGGTIVAVGMRVTGAALAVIGKRKYIRPQLPGFYPKSITPKMAPGAGVALPDSVVESSLNWTNEFVPHVLIGSNLLAGAVPVPEKRNYEDLFDVADTSGFPTIGSNFSQRSTILSTSGMYIRDLAVGWSGNDDGSTSALYKSPMTTDKTYTRIRIGAVEAAARPPWSRLLFRCSSDTATGLSVSFKQGTLNLDRKTAASASVGSYTTIETHAITWAEGDLIEVWNGEQIADILYPGRVIVKVNGVTIVNTTVASSVVPYGIGKRYGGFGVQRDNFYNSFRIRDFKIQDVPDV